MFEHSLVESTQLLRTRNRWPAITAIATQVLIVTVILTIPLLHPELLPTGDLKLSTLTPPVLRHPTPPPAQPVHIALATSANTLAAPTQPAILQRPAPGTDAPPVDAPALPFGDPNGRPAANLLAALGSAPAAPAVTGANPSHTTGPVRISRGVTEGMLLAPIHAEYPQIARITRTEGTVIVQAIISRTGRIESAHVLSGPTMLQSAALDAIRSARYHPYLLNGQPTEVETTITVNFRLGN